MFKVFLKEKGLSPFTIASYDYYVERFKAQFPQKPHNNKLFKEYLFYCKSIYSPGTISIILASIEKYCEYINLKFDSKIKRELNIKTKFVFMDVLTKEEVCKIINLEIERDEFGRNRNSLLLKLLYYSGIRVTELTTLKKSDVKEDSISILGKGNKRREIPIPAFLIKELNTSCTNEYLFKSRQNQAITARSINKIIKKRVEKANIRKKVSAHTFRRSFCTNLIKSGANIKIVSLLMGHSKIETTARYMHFSKEYIFNEYLKHI